MHLRKLRAILWVLVYPTLLKCDLIKRIKRLKIEATEYVTQKQSKITNIARLYLY